MGWLTKALSPEDPAAPLLPGSWLSEALGIGQGSDSGISVNERSALRISGVLACVRVLAETMGSLPLNVYQKLPQGKRLAEEHPLFPVLHATPNGQMTSYVYHVSVQAQTCLWGNGYSEIQRDGANRVRGLWPLPSDRTKPYRRDGKLLYVTSATANGQERIIQPENILHLPFLSFDGLQGYSPIQLQRQGLGLSSAAERFGALLFGRGSRPSGILTHPGTLKPEARSNMKSSFQEATSGANALSAILLEEGVTFNPMQINPNDAQFLETRKFQLEEICRWYRVPPHLAGSLERATHSNIEQQSLDFMTYGMLPWVTLWEMELNKKLFAGSQFYAKYNMDGFLRGDFATRMTGYQMMRNAGVLSANNINDMEDWPRIPEEEGGDIRIVPLNMVSLEMVKNQENAAGDAPETDGTVPGDEGGIGDNPDAGSPGEREQQLLRERYALAFLRLFHDATGRTINREKRDVAFVQKVWLPTLTTLAESMAALKGKNALAPETSIFLAGYVATLAKRCTEWKQGMAVVTSTMEFHRAYNALVDRV